MRDSVRQHWLAFTEPLEGKVSWMYTDVKGLVSIGIGNLIDPIQMALALPFVRPDGSPAGRDEIAAEWLRVKSDLAGPTAGHLHFERICKLRLTDDGIADLVSRKLNQNDALMVRRFPDFESWPADAQLATHSMCWAVGPAFRFPLLSAALQRQDFVTASVECHMDEHAEGVYNAGLVPRNRQNRMLYRNAAYVVAHDMDREVLHWPRDIEVDNNKEVTQPNAVPAVRPTPLQAVTVNDFPVVYGLPDPPDPPDDAA